MLMLNFLTFEMQRQKTDHFDLQDGKPSLTLNHSRPKMIRALTLTLGFSILLLLPRIGWGDEPTGLTVEIKETSSTRFDLIATTTVNSQFSALISLNLENLVPSTSQTLFNLSGTGQTTLLSLDMLDPNGGYSYSFGYQWNFGHSGTAHNDDYPYRIPYSTSESFDVGQEYFGTFSHQNSYAIDWDLPEGTNVRAAREGVVIDLKEDSNEAGTEERHLDMANYVTIGHDDGSQAIYVHLQMNGALVELGDWVTTGEIIGLSGNTGFSTGPHLHFKVSQQKEPGRLCEHTHPLRGQERYGSEFGCGRKLVELDEGSGIRGERGCELHGDRAGDQEGNHSGRINEVANGILAGYLL